jgi:signal transduction histidine kinase
MLDSLRTQLTSWFLALFLLLYIAGGGLALLVFNSVLSNQLDEDLHELTSELRPSIEFLGQNPTLGKWAEHLSNYHHIILPTIQLYDDNGRILEEYGPPGVAKLADGDLTNSVNNLRINVRSSNKKLSKENNQQDGYLQEQDATKGKNEALFKLGRNLILLAPVFAIAIWFAGQFFSATAIKPLGQTLDLLRRFVADAGHEFNTPITVIEASVQTLEQMLQESHTHSAADSRALADVLEGVSRASARMKDLASSLMLLARMENPELVSHMAPVALDDLLEPLLKEFRSLALKKKIDITCNSAPSVVAVAHADSLRTMFSNLLDNALAYTEAGGKITLDITIQDNNVVLSVTDTGIGIPADSIGHIFERFYRVDKSRSRSLGGSGLGLSIVKAIVDAHKGVIKAESRLGEGTKFTVLLPARV